MWRTRQLIDKLAIEGECRAASGPLRGKPAVVVAAAVAEARAAGGEGKSRHQHEVDPTLPCRGRRWREDAERAGQQAIPAGERHGMHGFTVHDEGYENGRAACCEGVHETMRIHFLRRGQEDEHSAAGGQERIGEAALGDACAGDRSCMGLQGVPARTRLAALALFGGRDRVGPVGRSARSAYLFLRDGFFPYNSRPAGTRSATRPRCLRGEWPFSPDNRSRNRRGLRGSTAW